MNLPNFIIFGAIKSGTGALCQYLSHHPDIYVSSFKEPRYFTRDVDNSSLSLNSNNKSIFATTLDEYSAHFSSVCSEKAIGEGSSNYIYSAKAAEEIRQTLPNIKLIASLRNPVDRAWAHYQMMNKYKSMNCNNISYCKNEEWAIASLYFEALQAYYNIFNKDQLKVIIYEEWVNNTRQMLKDLYQFLEVDDSFEVDSRIYYQAAKPLWPGIRPENNLRKIKNIIPTMVLMKVNKFKNFITPAIPKLQTKERNIMNDWYRDDIYNLQKLLQRDLSIWKITT